MISLQTEEQGIIVRDMLTMNGAIDLFAGDLSRRGCSDRTRTTYTRILGKLADRLPADLDVTRITSDDCRRFLDQYNRRAAGTRAHAYAVLSSFFRWLIVTEQIKRSPMTTIPRPQRKRPDELDVTTISTGDVRKLLAAGQTWTEKLAVAIPVYIGPRRAAIARLRLRDYDTARRRLRFYEKGGKVIWKPVPDELANLLGAAIADGAIVEPDDYLVPPEGHLNRTGDRDDRIVWRVVKRVADRAGVDAHVHALRAAFAVFYLERNPGDTHGLQKLLGHRNPATTEVYLRKLDTETSMERVRGLSWAVDESGLETGEVANDVSESSLVVGAGGFEPPNPDSDAAMRPNSQHLLLDLLDEARLASDQATREEAL
jgi:integrase